MAAAGIGANAGRCSARPSAREKSRFVAGSGAEPLTAPEKPGLSSAASSRPISSSRWIHGMYCLPPATGPPTPSLNGVSIVASAPESASSTMPVRTIATRIPSPSASSASRSHATETAARKSSPAGASSPTRSSPWGP